MGSTLRPLADILVHQPLAAGGKVAAPCFNYYPYKENGEPDMPLEPEDLYSALLELVAEAAALAAQDPSTQKYVQQLKDIATTITPLTPRP